MAEQKCRARVRDAQQEHLGKSVERAVLAYQKKECPLHDVLYAKHSYWLCADGVYRRTWEKVTRRYGTNISALVLMRSGLIYLAEAAACDRCEPLYTEQGHGNEPDVTLLSSPLFSEQYRCALADFQKYYTDCWQELQRAALSGSAVGKVAVKSDASEVKSDADSTLRAGDPATFGKLTAPGIDKARQITRACIPPVFGLVPSTGWDVPKGLIYLANAIVQHTAVLHQSEMAGDVNKAAFVRTVLLPLKASYWSVTDGTDGWGIQSTAELSQAVYHREIVQKQSGKWLYGVEALVPDYGMLSHASAKVSAEKKQREAREAADRRKPYVYKFGIGIRADGGIEQHEALGDAVAVSGDATKEASQEADAAFAAAKTEGGRWKFVETARSGLTVTVTPERDVLVEYYTDPDAITIEVENLGSIEVFE